MRLITLVFLLTAGAAAAQDDAIETYTPARFQSGKLPDQPPLASAGGLTILELDIAASGIVTDAVALAEAAPFTEALREATRLWRFDPADEDGAAVRSKALVIGVFRPPVLMGSALPEPESVRPPAEDVPYPTATSVPDYPPTALYEGVAAVEVAIDESGTVTDARMLSTEAGYDEPSLDAAMAFRFRPARRDGKPVESFAVIFFGFRQPVTTPTFRR